MPSIARPQPSSIWTLESPELSNSVRANKGRDVQVTTLSTLSIVPIIVLLFCVIIAHTKKPAESGLLESVCAYLTWKKAAGDTPRRAIFSARFLEITCSRSISPTVSFSSDWLLVRFSWTSAIVISYLFGYISIVLLFVLNFQFWCLYFKQANVCMNHPG